MKVNSYRNDSRTNFKAQLALSKSLPSEFKIPFLKVASDFQEKTRSLNLLMILKSDDVLENGDLISFSIGYVKKLNGNKFEPVPISRYFFPDSFNVNSKDLLPTLVKKFKDSFAGQLGLDANTKNDDMTSSLFNAIKN